MDRGQLIIEKLLKLLSILCAIMSKPNLQKFFTELNELAATFPAIEKIVLFGSRARGDNSARSDIDIAIIAPTITNKEWLDLCEKINELDTLLELDVINFCTTNSELQNRINQEGKFLYERN